MAKSRHNRNQTLKKPATVNAADDQVTTADTEDKLQKGAQNIKSTNNRIWFNYTSVQKTKSMAFKGQDPVRTKIVIDKKL